MRYLGLLAGIGLILAGSSLTQAVTALPAGDLQNSGTDWSAVNLMSAGTYNFQSGPLSLQTTVTIYNLGTCWVDGNGVVRKDVAWFDLGVGNTPGPWAGTDGIWASAVADFGPTDKSFYYPDSQLHGTHTQVVFHDWTPLLNDTTVRNSLKFHLQDRQGQDEMGTVGVRANVLYWKDVTLPQSYTWTIDFNPDLDGVGGNAIFSVSQGGTTVTLNSMRWEDDLSNVHVWAGLANSGGTWNSGTSHVDFGDVEVIPEPVTMAGVILGIGSVVTYVRKRRMA